MRQQFTSIALLILSPLAWSAPVDVAKLAELTIANSPTIQQAANDLELAELEHRNAFWRFFPSLGLEATHGVIGNDPVTRSTPAHSELALTLDHSFYSFDNATTFGRYEQTKAAVERSRLQFEQARDEELLKVVQAYLAWSSNTEIRAIQETKRGMLRKQFSVLNAQYKQGLKTKRDVLRIETEIRRMEIEILRLENQIDMDLQRLASTVGVDRAELGQLALKIEKPKPAQKLPPLLPELKAENHRTFKVFKLREQEATYETGFVRREYWPKLALESEVRYYNHDYLDTGARFDENRTLTWQTMLVLRYNLWDWGLRRRDVQAARIRERTIASENRGELLDLTTELRDVFLKLKQFREHLGATHELLNLEQQSYSVLESEYRNGRSTYLDLITNLNSLVDARAKFSDSYFGFLRQQYVYSFHKGSLYGDLKKQ